MYGLINCIIYWFVFTEEHLKVRSIWNYFSEDVIILYIPNKNIFRKKWHAKKINKDFICTGSCLAGAPLWLLHKHRSASSPSGLHRKLAGLETLFTGCWSSEKASGLPLLRAARQLLSDTQQAPSTPFSPWWRGPSSGGPASRLNLPLDSALDLVHLEIQFCVSTRIAFHDSVFDGCKFFKEVVNN